MKVLLIGAGNIAGAKPMAKKDGPCVTHIQAILADKRFKLAGIVDVDHDAAVALAERWVDNLPSIMCANTINAFYGASIDVVVIATPPSTHLSVVRKVFANLDPKHVLLEKPGGTNVAEALEIDKLCAEYDCELWLNYQRNYSAQINLAMIENKIGKVQSARCDYVRGLRNDASHAIALFEKLFGDSSARTDLRPSVAGHAIDDIEGDKTITAAYSLPRCESIMLCGHDGRFFDLFEITLYGERGTICFEDHGQKVILNEIRDEGVYGSYKKLQHTRVNLGDADLSLTNVYNEIADDRMPLFVNYANTWHTISQIESAYMKTN
jgi:predicted dehydrogenase